MIVIVMNEFSVFHIISTPVTNLTVNIYKNSYVCGRYELKLFPHKQTNLISVDMEMSQSDWNK